jgi:hypothetical protein
MILLPWLLTAHAHGLDAHRLTLEVEDAVVRVTATPGVEAFASADTNRDGQLDRAEVAAARAHIRATFEGAVRLSDLAGERPVCDAASVSTVGEGADHVRISLRCAFVARPTALFVAYDLPSTVDLSVEAVRVWKFSDNQWMPEGPVERAVLPVGGAVELLEDACPR